MAENREKVWDDTWRANNSMTSNEIVERAPVSRSEAEKLREDFNSGSMDIENMPEEESSRVFSILEVLDQAETFERMGAGRVAPPQANSSQNAVQSVTGPSAPMPEEGLEDSGVDYTTFTSREFIETKPQRPESEKYAGPIVKSAILDAAINEKPIVAAVQAAYSSYQRTGDEEAHLRTVAGTEVDAETQRIRQIAERIDMFQPTEDIEADLQAIQEDMEELRKLGANPDYVFWSTVASPQVRQEAVRQFAVDDQIRDMVNATFEGMGILDWTRNLFGIFVPGKDAYDNMQFTDSVFNADTFINKFIENFRSMDPDKQTELLPSIQAWVQEELPELRQVEFFNALASPEYKQDTSGFNWFNAALSAVDFAGWAVTIGAVASKLNHSRRIAKGLKEAGREDLAGEAVGAALVTRTPLAKDMVGMDDVSLVNTASPFATEFLDPNSVDNISRQVFDNVAEFEVRTKETSRQITQGDEFLRERAFSTKELEDLEEKKKIDFMRKNGVENAQVVERSDTGFTLEYEAFDDNGISLGISQEKFTFTLTDKQGITVDPVGMFSRWIASPLTFLKGEEGRALVKQAERLDNQQAKLLNSLRTLQREAVSSIIGKSGIGGLSPIARKKLEELDFILLKGDQEKAVYTVDELMNGSLGIALKEDQVEAYYKTRSLMDSLVDIREDVVRREAQLRGEAGVIIKGREHIAKPYASLQEAQQSIRDSGRKQFFFDDEDQLVYNFDEVDLEKWYNQGWVMTRLKEPTAFTEDGNKVFYAFVKADDVGGLPTNILPRRVGYIPKINNGVAYFVKESTSHTVDGVAIAASDARASTRTVRAFARREEADAYVLELERAAKAEGKNSDQVVYRTLEDRQLEQEAALSSMGEEHALARPGGLFSGARAEELLYGIEGTDINRVDSFTAISQNLSNLAKYVSRNEWRLSMEKMAVETANALEGSGNRVFRSFDDLVKAPMGTSSGRTIRALHSQVDDWMSWPSAEEMAFKYTIQKMIDSSIGGKLPKGAVDTLFDLKNTDPTGAMRAAAFHGLLGWFNPVQLWVQAQGAAVSVAMNIFDPATLTRVFRDQSFLQFMGHTAGTDKIIAQAAKASGMKESEAAGLYRAWRRSGLEDSVLTTADHAAAARGRGVAMDAVSRTAEKGLFFYRSGELFNRRMAFSTAYNEWKKASKSSELTDDALKGIIDRSHDLMLNMGKANRAAWQKGIFGVATQFQQVSAKTIETLFGMNGNFTGAERAKILLTQGLLYGGAGVPLGTMGSQYIAELMGYEDQVAIEREVGPGFVKAMNEGFTGWFTLAVLGVDANVGDRSSLISGVEGIVDNFLFGEGNFATSLLGAFTGPAGDFWSGVTGQYEPLSLGLAENRPVNIARAIVNPFLSSVKTFKNVDKALFMHRFGRIVDKNFQTVVQGPFNWKEELAVAIGFQHNREVTTRSLEEQNKVRNEWRGKVVNEIVRINYQAALWSNNNEFTEDRRQMVAEAIAVLYQSLDNNYEKKQAREAVSTKLRDSRKSKEAAAWQEFRRRHAEGTIDNAFQLEKFVKGHFSSIRPELRSQGLLREGVYDTNEVQE